MPVRILVVDDDAPVLRFAGRALERAGFDVLCARTTAAAEACAGDGIDIALVDLYLGAGADGLQFAHHVRERAGADVLVMTGRPGMETAVAALREGVYDYLIKPFGAAELVRAVERCAERRRLSAELARERDLQKRLADEIARRERLEGRVRHAQKMEAIGRLSSMISHDFNSYLNIILGSAHLILENRLDPQVRMDVEQIRRTALDAASLTRQILEFAKGEEAPGGCDPAVDLNDLIREMSCLLKRAAGAGVRVEAVPAAKVPPVRFDPVRLRQVLVNLTVNARDAMPDGGVVSIRIAAADIKDGDARLYPDGRPGSYAVLEVADTGSGMSPETLDRIFEPYFTTKPAGKGSGLGLPIVYGVVRQAGGRVEVESEEGRGTVVRLYLPAEVEAPAARVPEPGGREPA